MRLRIILSVALLLAMLLPAKTFAWGMTGHRIVGEVASRHLSSKAKAAIKKILGTESLAMASNWADFVKSDSTYKYLDTWHYVNLPVGLDRAAIYNFLDMEKEANIYNKTLEMIEILKKPGATLSERQMAMRLLIHFIGDMNQPMHTARKEDLGGNRVSVMWFNEKTNLHSLWDSKLIDHQQLSYTEYANAVDNASPIELVNLKKGTIRDAVYDAYQASNKIYSMTKPDAKLSYRYNFDFLELLNIQLRNGGIRLAQVLNNIYG